MKSLTNMMIAAAALMVAVGSAEAQVIKAEVPFSFRASGTVLPAGEYWVKASNLSNGSPILAVTNIDTHRSILAVPYTSNNEAAGSSAASLTFECGGAHCALVKVAAGTGRQYQFAQPRLGRDENSRVAVIRAVLLK